MLTSLDLLVLVFIGLAAATLISLCMMFMMKNKIVQKVFFYITLCLGLYNAFWGFMVSSGLFPGQTTVAILTALLCVAALVLDILSKGNNKRFLVARIIATAALIIGFLNAFIF